MNENPATREARTFRSVVGVAVVFFLAFLAVAGFKSYRDLAAARAREAELVERIRATEERIGGLDREIRRLRDDPATLERLAREELGLVEPGDLVIVLPDDGSEAPDQPRGAVPAPTPETP